MPNISEIKNSKFLCKEDVGEGILVTMTDCTQENVAMQGAPPELKWALHFDELEKPLILNSVNAQIIAKITGNDQTENWTGKRVVLYTDHSIQFQGRLVGGIRVRAMKGKAAAASQSNRSAPMTRPPVQPDPEPITTEEDDVPF